MRRGIRRSELVGKHVLDSRCRAGRIIAIGGAGIRSSATEGVPMVEVVSLSRWSTVEPLLSEFESHLATDAPRLRIVHANDSDWSYEEYRQRKREFKVCSG